MFSGSLNSSSENKSEELVRSFSMNQNLVRPQEIKVKQTCVMSRNYQLATIVDCASEELIQNVVC